MTKEQSFLLEILQAAIKGETVQALPEDIRWENLIREVKAHAVLLPVYDTLAPVRDRIPALAKAEQDAMRVMLANLNLERAQAELVAVLEQDNCPYVILKGLSAAAWYPKAQTRHLGDVDFMIPPDRMEAVTAQMQQQGYDHIWEPSDHHWLFTKNSIRLEMHIEIAGMPDGEDRAPVQAFLESLYEDRQLLHTDMDCFYAPSTAKQAVILLLHMQHHIVGKGMGLRHVMDWACFMNENAQKPFWQEQVLPLLTKIGLFHFSAVMTKLSAIFLGSPCPPWAEYADDILCHDMMQDILNGGNFGQKDGRRAHSVALFPNWEQKNGKDGKFVRLYNNLRNAVLVRYPNAKKYPAAVFVLMIAKAVRYIFLYCTGKRTNWSELTKLAEERESVYRRLRMYEKGDQN